MSSFQPTTAYPVITCIILPTMPQINIYMFLSQSLMLLQISTAVIFNVLLLTYM